MDGTQIEALLRRSEKAWSEAQHHHSALRELYRWTNPKQWLAMTQGMASPVIGLNNNQSASDHIFDATGRQALKDGANQIAEALHPWDQQWARWVPRADVSDQIREQVEKVAEEYTRLTNAMLATSNFDAEAPASHQDFLGGTGFLLMSRDDRDPMRLRFTAVPAWQWAIEADSAGRIQAAFRRVSCRARDLQITVPGATWPEELLKKAQDQPDVMIRLEMAIWWMPESNRWKTCWYACEGRHHLWSQDSRTSPAIVYRAMRIAGQAWGDGPGFEALPDIKVCNRVVELTLKNAAFAVTGVWQADDDGVLNPNTIKLVPGAIIPKAVGSGGLQPLEFPGQLNVSELVLADMRTNIRRAFYVTRVEERDMTAEEYRGRLMQQLRDQRGTYGQLRSEFITPLMLRCIDLAVEMGIIQETAFEKLAQVELTGPLAMDVRGAEVERVKQVAADLAMLVGPEVAMAAMKLEELVPFVRAQRAAKSEVFRERDEMITLGKRIMEMVAQQRAAQMGAPPAEGAM
jgi:hypothetical protein